MASRTEKASRRVAKKVQRGSRSAAAASRDAARALDRVEKVAARAGSRSGMRRAKEVVSRTAKAVGIGALAFGARKAVAAGKKLKSTLARQKTKQKLKKGAKIAGAAVALVGAAVLARKALRKR